MKDNLTALINIFLFIAKQNWSYFAVEPANVPVTEFSLTDEEIKWLQEDSEHYKGTKEY